MALRFISGLGDGFGIDEAVAGRAGLVKGGLRAETAILGAAAGLGVDDGAEVNFVPFEMFPDSVGPREQVVDVGGVPDLKQPQGFVARHGTAVEHTPAERRDPFGGCQVNHFMRHG